MDSNWQDHYEALELEFGATDEEIKKSYRDLMKKYHPDSKFADEIKAKKVNAAYDVLGDPDKRKNMMKLIFNIKMANLLVKNKQKCLSILMKKCMKHLLKKKYVLLKE